MSSKFHFTKVRTWMTVWFLVLALIPVIVSSTIIYFQRVEVIRLHRIERLTVIRDLKVLEINSWLDERAGDLRIISSDLEILQVAKLHDKTPSPIQYNQNMDTARDLLQRYIDNSLQYNELFLIDSLKGKIFLSTDRHQEGLSKLKDPYFTQPLKSGNIFIKDIYYSRALRSPAMTFSIPLFDPEESHIGAILVARIDLEHSLFPLLADRTGMGETGETLIVNKDGMALNELRWQKDAPLKLKIAAKPASLASQGHKGTIEVLDYRGARVLAAYTHIPIVGWGLVAKQDSAEVFQSIHQMLKSILLLLAISTGVIFLIAFYMARKISSPIMEIKEVASKLRQGDLSARNSIVRHDELGFLSDSINEMAESIESTIQVQKSSGELIGSLVTFEDLNGFVNGLLKKLMGNTNSNLAAFYIRNNQGRTFEIKASIGADAKLLKSFDAQSMEGELGIVMATKEIQHITKIREDTRFTFNAVAGSALPREIITIPLLERDEVGAIVSLANLKGYSDESLDIIKTCWVPMCTAFENILSNEKTRLLATQLQSTNEKLGDVNEELRVRSEELQSQSEELQEQADELRETASALEAQRLQVEDADRLKSEFLSNMSHELRTPLNSVLALSQLMIARGTGKNPEEEKEFLEVIERNGRQLLGLINDILDLSKIESGRMDIFTTVFETQNAVNRAIDTVWPIAQQKGLKLDVNIEKAPSMESDEDKVNQILLNLLSNAVKFTEQGSITVDVATNDKRILFTVRDTGIGIAPEDLPHIFDEFRQVDGSVTRRHEGTGLGLAISQKLAMLLGGKISVESIEGEGSTFSLELPLRISPSADQIKETSSLPNTGRPLMLKDKPVHPAEKDGKIHILLVEDNEIAALQVRTALEENGYAVIVASDGEEALESVRRAVPDGIVLDLMMPGIDGFQVLETIRSTPRTKNLPVLVLTAKELTSQDRARLTSNNIHQLIHKGSVNREQLVAAVRSMFKVPEVKPEPVVVQSKLKPKPGGIRTILIVEDNPDNMLTVTSVLADVKNCKIITAQDGKQAVEMAEKEKPGLILMDIQLPDMSGIEATRQIKTNPDLAGIPIIALTASAMKGDREKMMALGCNDYMSKPFEPKKLLDIVRKWLG
jgi:signal transduction histidine kinase/DNA-binding response OmpR family regulator/HAMP domain-containing protein